MAPKLKDLAALARQEGHDIIEELKPAPGVGGVATEAEVEGTARTLSHKPALD